MGLSPEHFTRRSLRSSVVLTLRGAADAAALADWDDQVRAAIEHGATAILLDVREITTFDHEALRWLGGLKRLLDGRGIELVLALGRHELESVIRATR